MHLNQSTALLGAAMLLCTLVSCGECPLGIIHVFFCLFICLLCILNYHQNILTPYTVPFITHHPCSVCKLPLFSHKQKMNIFLVLGSESQM
uniref:Secreted protein n=1 Tax=Anguilla anguilla TaxID=7936 RepID=A0A0E9Q5K9_ANGAN